MATKEEIEQIINQTDIVDLVSKYVKLEKTGKNYRGLCPFHNEKTPSFTVSTEKHLAHCFSCGKGGNPIQFLMDIEHLNFNEAVNELASKNGIKLSNPYEDKKSVQYTKYYELMQLSKDFFVRNLTVTKNGQVALEYLHKRGLDDETIKLFGIGLAPVKGDALYQVLKDSNYLELDMMDLGLVKKSEKGYYDLFTRRLMFPITDEKGKVIAFSGRIYQGEKDQPKYINSPESPVFDKGKTIYNLYNAQRGIVKNKRVILHEGQMDVIASVKSGLTEAVCTLGTALTINQANMLKRYTDHAIVCYDGDSAGIKASLKAINIFKSVGMKVHLVLLPDGMDPDEYVSKYGKEEYVKYFEDHIVEANEYVYLQAIKNKDSKDSEVIENIKNQIFAFLTQEVSQTQIEAMIQRLSNDLHVSEAALYVDYNEYCKSHPTQNFVEKNVASKNNYNNYNGYDNTDDYSYEYQSNYPSNYNEVDNNYYQKAVIKPQIFTTKLAELRIFEYAKISREKAMYISSFNILDEALEAQNIKLWWKIEDYYDHYAEFDEGTFVHLLSEDEKSCYIGNVKALAKVESVLNQYTDDDLDLVINKLKEIKALKAIESKNKDVMEATSETEKLDALTKKLEIIRQMNKNKKKVG